MPVLAAALILLALLLPASAGAAACDFTGTSGGDWDVGTNWSCNAIPDGDDAVTLAGKTVRIDVNASAASVATSGPGTPRIRFAAGAALAVSGSFAVTDALTLVGDGALTVEGPVTKSGIGTLSATNDDTFGASPDLTFNGPATLTGGSICISDSGDGNPDLPHLTINDTFTVAAGSSATAITCSGGPHIRVAPGGHLVKSAPGATVFAHAIDNDGTLTVEAGSLEMRGGTAGQTSDGDYVAAAGTTLTFGSCCSEAFQVGPTGRVGGAGTFVNRGNPTTIAAGATFDPAVLQIPFATVVLDGTGPQPLPSVTISGGHLDTDRAITTPSLSLTSGSIRGEGSVTVPPGGSFAKTTSAGFSVTANLNQAAADLILETPATLEGGSICVARSDDSNPDKPTMQIRGPFTIGTEAGSTAFTCSGSRVHVHGPDGRLAWAGSGTTSASGAIELVDGGTLAVAAGQTFNIVNGLFLTGGVLTGTGAVTAAVSNPSGTVRPGASPGVLTVNGSYTQGPAGKLEVEVAGTAPGTQFDRLVVSGAANLAGTLAILNAPGFDPAPADVFQILSAGGVNGAFTTLTGAALGSETYVAQHNPTDVTLALSPGPAVTGAPSIPDAATEGDALTCDPGAWSGTPTFDFQWFRGGTPVAGATSPNYAVTAADVGAQLLCRVTATNPSGSAQADSNVVVPVAKAADPPPPGPSTSTPPPGSAPPPVTPAPGSAPPPIAPPPDPRTELPPSASRVAQVFGLPSARRCRSRRRFTIRLREPRGLAIRSARVQVRGRRAVRAKRRRGRMTAVVDLRGLPKKTFVVTIRLVLTDGRRATGRRTYRTCTPRRR